MTLLHVAIYSKQIDAHSTDDLILKHKYDYYVYLSRVFCYAKFRIPLDFQNKLGDSIRANRTATNENEKEKSKEND